jgi:Protein of unknown function (DUF2892)
MPIIRFIASQPGRVARAVIGLALIAAGASLGGWWWLLAVVGLLPLAAGLFDFCTLGPLFGLPFSGRRIREIMARRR